MEDANPTASSGPSLDERHRWLNLILQDRLNRRGWRLEFYSETSAILVNGRPVRHVLHFLFTVITGGLWMLPWLLIAVLGGEWRESIYIHPDGQPEVRRLQ